MPYGILPMQYQYCLPLQLFRTIREFADTFSMHKQHVANLIKEN
jgi:hypothetical protein